MDCKTPIYLSNEEIEVWKWCWQNYGIFNKLIKIAKPCKLVLHLNASGEVKPELTIFGKNNIKKLTP